MAIATRQDLERAGRAEDTTSASLPTDTLVAPRRRPRVVRRTEGLDPAAGIGGLPPDLLAVPVVRPDSGLIGPAALAAVLGFYGLDVREAEVARRAGGSHERSVGPADLVRAAQAFGLEAEYRTGATSAEIVRFVGQDRIPLIVFWFDGTPRASVVAGSDDAAVYLMDPAAGSLVKVDWPRFVRAWFSFGVDRPVPGGVKVGECLVVRP